MTSIAHHIPDHLLQAYAAGTLHYSMDMVIAAHVSMCDECRARLAAHECAGGAVLEEARSVGVSQGMRARVLAALDAPCDMRPPRRASGVFPAPVMEALSGQPPKWQKMGAGVRQSLLHADKAGSVRLLYIPGGQAVPDHGHHGLELTLVLQGAFSDEGGRFGVGDVEVADDSVEHTPIAEIGPACICLAATEGSLRFNALIPRLLQPFLRI